MSGTEVRKWGSVSTHRGGAAGVHRFQHRLKDGEKRGYEWDPDGS